MIDREHPGDRRRRYLRYAAIVLAVIMFVSAGFFFMEKWERRTGVFDDSADNTLGSTLTHNGNEYVLKDNVEAILVLGLDETAQIDASSYNNSKQADFLMLYVLDNNANTCKAIHINRDTMATMNVLGVAGDRIDTVTKQIALSHTYGNGKEVSCRNTADAVSTLLMNVDIDHFVSVSLDAVPVFNNLVGGVTVEVLDDFGDIDPTLVKGQKVKLSDEQALKYIQSRYGVGDQTNSNRMARQRQYLKALYEQFCNMSAQNESFGADAALKITDYIVSDCSVNKLEGYLNKIPSYEFLGITDIEGEVKTDSGFVEFYPNEQSIKQAVIDTFYCLK